MDERIKAAFEELKAEQQLKTSTKYFIYDKYNSSAKIKRSFPTAKALTAAAVCLLVVISVSVFTYITPVSAISLDADTSSVELGINCFDKVVAVDCFGDTSCPGDLNLKNMNYKEAVATVLEQTETFDSSTVLTVSCKNNSKGSEMAKEINNCHATDTEVQQHNGNHDLSAEAHSLNISTGKYQAYLVLKQYEPELTVDLARDMTMRELRERISFYTTEASPNDDTTVATTCCNNETSSNHHHKNKNH